MFRFSAFLGSRNCSQTSELAVRQYQLSVECLGFARHCSRHLGSRMEPSQQVSALMEIKFWREQ